MLRQNQTTVAVSTCRERPETDMKRHGLVCSIPQKKIEQCFQDVPSGYVNSLLLKMAIYSDFHDFSH